MMTWTELAVRAREIGGLESFLFCLNPISEDKWYSQELSYQQHADWPSPGLFEIALIKGGGTVAAAMFVPCPMDLETCEPNNEGRKLQALVNGKWNFNPFDICMACKGFGERVSAQRYQYLIDDRAWAAKFAPHLPEADPWRAVAVDKPKSEAKRDTKKDVDINDLKPIF